MKVYIRVPPILGVPGNEPRLDISDPEDLSHPTSQDPNLPDPDRQDLRGPDPGDLQDLRGPGTSDSADLRGLRPEMRQKEEGKLGRFEGFRGKYP